MLLAFPPPPHCLEAQIIDSADDGRGGDAGNLLTFVAVRDVAVYKFQKLA